MNHNFAVVEEAPPPSLEQFESEVIPGESAFEFDMGGNEITQEERQEMIWEQEKILKPIQEDVHHPLWCVSDGTAFLKTPLLHLFCWH